MFVRKMHLRFSHLTLLVRILSWAIAAMGLSMGGTAKAGSPFYLTVERSFSPQENPEIRVDVTGKSRLLTFRILKAKNVDAFLEGQLNLARSYEEPEAWINPGHFLMKGINRIQSPFFAARTLVNKEVRKDVAGALESIFNHMGGGPNVARVPTTFRIAPPAGFDVVKEILMDSTAGFQKRRDGGSEYLESDEEDDCDECGYYGSSYSSKTLKLDPLPPGLYLVQMVSGTTEAQALLQVSNVSAHLSRSNHEVVVRILNRSSRPVAGFNLEMRAGNGTWKKLGAPSGNEGEIFAKNVEMDSRSVFRVTNGAQEFAYIDSEFLPVEGSSSSLFLQTDRPIFKPGERFSFKGVMRTGRPGAWDPPAGGRLDSLSLMTLKGEKIQEIPGASLTSHGSFSGSFDLAPSANPGVYKVVAKIRGESHSGELRVRDYVKPTFFVKIGEIKGNVLPGEKFTLNFNAQRYSGGAASDVKYIVYVYRKKFESPAFVEEAGAGLSTGSNYFGNKSSAASQNPSQKIYSSYDQLGGGNGGEAPAGDEGGGASEGGSSSGYLSVDGQGNGHWEVALPSYEDLKKKEKSQSGEATQEWGQEKKAVSDDKQNWIYTVLIAAVDEQGASAVGSQNFYGAASEAAVSLDFPSVLTDVGNANLTLGLHSSRVEGGAAGKASGQVALELEKADGTRSKVGTLEFTTDDNGRSRVKIPPLKEPGRLYAVATLTHVAEKKMGHPFVSEPASILISTPDGKAVAANARVELVAERLALEPGEKARVFVLLPEGWGEKESGRIWMTTSGAQIYGTSSFEASGRTRWIELDTSEGYGTGFYLSLLIPMPGGRFQEAHIGLRLIGKKNLLHVAIEPERDTAEPQKPFRISMDVKKADGSPAANTELAVGVVDKAVYDVQKEFRPKAMDFYYPLPRQNLMSFLSDDLQGFGYADEIRKVNYKLDALKSQTMLPNLTYRDTAGWFPHVVTDANGHAEVTVDMPGNLTTWVVTAVAIDDATRIGENTAEFRSAVDVASTPVLSQFLRKGDVLQMSLRVTNTSPKNTQARVTADGKQGLKVDGLEGEEFPLVPNASVVKSFRVSPTQDSGEGVLSLGLLTSAGVRSGGVGLFPLRVMDGGLSQVFHADSGRPGQPTLGFPQLPPRLIGGVIQVSGASGLLGATLAAGRTLLQYPYGCTEQLVHSTLPNLALLNTFREAGLNKEAMAAFKDLQNRALANAKAGIGRILLNQKPDGGFSLWPSGDESTPEVTLVAMRGLSWARRVDVGVNVENALNKAQTYLRSHKAAGTFWDLASRGNPELISVAVENYAITYDQAKAMIPKVVAMGNSADFGTQVATLRLLQVLRQRGYATEGDLRPIQDKLLAAAQNHSPEEDNKKRFLALVGAGDAGPIFPSYSNGVLAQLLAALHEARVLTPELGQKLKGQILDGWNNGMWGSTYETAQVILSTLPLIREEAKQATLKAPLPLFAADGHEVGRLVPTLGGWQLSTDLPTGDLTAFKTLEVRGLPADSRVWAQVQGVQPLETIQPVKAPNFEVSRSFLRVVGGKLKGETRLQDLAVGDVVVSVTTFRRSAPSSWMGFASSMSRYVAITDAIPSLAEGVDEDKDLLAELKMSLPPEVHQVFRHPERTELILKSRWWAGESVTLATVWRVKFKGESALPPVQVIDLSNDLQRANSDVARVVVR